MAQSHARLVDGYKVHEKYLKDHTNAVLSSDNAYLQSGCLIIFNPKPQGEHKLAQDFTINPLTSYLSTEW